MGSVVMVGRRRVSLSFAALLLHQTLDLVDSIELTGASSFGGSLLLSSS